MQRSKIWQLFEHSGASGSLFDLNCADEASKSTKQLLFTDWSYITLLNFVKLTTLLIERGSHKRYATLTTLAEV